MTTTSSTTRDDLDLVRGTLDLMILKALIWGPKHGLAVLQDVVFNHAGPSDNALWSVANESFFDGDTEWGAMINFDHPQVAHFFEQNLVHFMTHYRVDGFRFDFTDLLRKLFELRLEVATSL